MGKVVKVDKHFKKAEPENYACCVMITCSEPNAEGKMEVEMNVDGDETLAAFLLENASQVFDDRFDCRKSK